MEIPMRRITAFSIAVALVAVGTLVGAWAVTTTGAQGKNQSLEIRINTLELTTSAQDLPIQQFDAI
jgi:hypothetical protein